VDVEALAEGLDQGILAGAALDVYEVEPPPSTLPLFGMTKVILTPHVGWASEESGWEIRRDILADIVRFSEGKNACHVVNGIDFEKR